MDNLILFDKSTLKALLIERAGETKFGEHVQLLTNVCNIYEQLKNLDVEFVIFGIPEDVGVIANHGKPGALNTWEATIKILLNTQSNLYSFADKTLILGEIDCQEELSKLKGLDQNKKGFFKKVRKQVSKIDKKVSFVVHEIVKAGKIPIIIGGGQNNAYGNLKGTALAKNSAINAVNLDAHTDFRAEEGRHSGNGFTYAFKEGFLKNYFILGLHEDYSPDKVLQSINKIKAIQYNTFEAIKIRKEIKFKNALQEALEHVSNTCFGIELDCDAIQAIPSSAQTPSGFNVNNAREFITYFGKHSNASYLHICEAAPNQDQALQVGKMIAYFISDFMRAKMN